LTGDQRQNIRVEREITDCDSFVKKVPKIRPIENRPQEFHFIGWGLGNGFFAFIFPKKKSKKKIFFMEFYCFSVDFNGFLIVGRKIRDGSYNYGWLHDGDEQVLCFLSLEFHVRKTRFVVREKPQNRKV